MLFALGIQAFLAIKEKPFRKEKALRILLESALHTGCGEINELLYGLKDLDRIELDEIYSIYDLKTAHYTFVTPLVMGATLAGANKKVVRKLSECGRLLGRAFQIKDDLLGIFGKEEKIGKSVLTDLQEAKRTILIWHGYRNSGGADRKRIKKLMSKTKTSKSDLAQMRGILLRSGAKEHAESEMLQMVKEAKKKIISCRLAPEHKKTLLDLIAFIFKP
jgi:geranylgeranyl pyrophosphate synthase